MGKSTRIFYRYLLYGTSQWVLGLSSGVGFASAFKLFPQGRRCMWNAQDLKLLNVMFLSWMEECAQTNLVESSSGGSVHGAGICLQASLEALNPARGGCTHTAFGDPPSVWGWVWLCWRHQPYSRNVVPEHCSTAFSSWQWDALCRTPSSYPGRMPMCMAWVPWAACRYRVNRCGFSSLPKNFENLMSLIYSVPSKIRCEYRETWLLELDSRVHLPSNIGPPRWSEGWCTW